MRKVLFISMFIALSLHSNSQNIASSQYSSYSLCNNTVKSWGYNAYGQLGIGSYTLSTSPMSVNTITDIKSIVSGLYDVLALKNDGTIWAWGWNKYGEIGNGTQYTYNIPTQTKGITGVTSVSAGDYHSLAIKNDSTVWAWGYNLRGQLGNGTNTDSSLPVKVNSLTGIIAVAGGGKHSLALKNDGTVWAWGDNGYGQLGNGTNNNSNVPVQVSSLSNIISIAAGFGFSLALKNDGTLWTWGYNDYSQLGDGGTTNRKVPFQVSAITNIKAIAAGESHVLALKSDGTVWAWGSNTVGEIGNGVASSTQVWIPTQVMSLTDIISVDAGTQNSLAMKSDGTLWAWGWNLFGQLGNGNQTDSGTPVQVTGLCSSATALSDNIVSTGISVFPNPCTGKFKVNCTEGSVNSIKIYNIEGRQIYTDDIFDNSDEIDLSSTPKGIYFLKMETNLSSKSTIILIQ